MKRDRLLVEKFLSAYNHHHGTSYKTVCWPEESNRKTEAVEAVASNELGHTIAFEHTLVEPFEGERVDSERFMRVFSRLEGSADLVKAGHDVDVLVHVGSIPTRISWDKVGERVHQHLASRILLLGSGRTSEPIPGLGFPLEVTVAIAAHDPGERDHVWISRNAPKDSLERVVRRALARKLQKLVAEPVERRVLLLEKADIVGGLTSIRAAIDRLAPEFPQLKMIHEIWLIITHCWDKEDTLFFYELAPELGNRRLILEKTSSENATVRILGAPTIHGD